MELENNWDVWREIAKWLDDNPGKTEKEMDGTTNKPKYTTKGGGNNTVLVEGWQVAGHDRFAELHSMVVEDRNSERGKQFEREFKDKQLQSELELGGTPQTSRKRKATVLEVASTEVNLLGELLAAVTPSPV